MARLKVASDTPVPWKTVGMDGEQEPFLLLCSPRKTVTAGYGRICYAYHATALPFTPSKTSFFLMQTRSVHFKRYNNAVDNHSVTIFMGGMDRSGLSKLILSDNPFIHDTTVCGGTYIWGL